MKQKISILCAIICCLWSCDTKKVEQKDVTVDVIISSDLKSSALPEKLQNLFTPSDAISDKDNKNTMFVPSGKINRVDLKTPATITVKYEKSTLDIIRKQIKKPKAEDIQRSIKDYLSKVDVTGLNSKEQVDKEEKINRLKEFIRQQQNEGSSYADILFYSENSKNTLWDNNTVYHSIDSIRSIVFESVSSNLENKFLIVYNPPYSEVKQPIDTIKVSDGQLIPNNSENTVKIGVTVKIDDGKEEPSGKTKQSGGKSSTSGTGNIVPPSPSHRTISVPGGIYKGEVIYKDGTPIPDGQGVIVYTSRTLIEPRDVKKRYAEAGQSVSGTFKDGHLWIGKLKDKDDIEIEVLNIGR